MTFSVVARDPRTGDFGCAVQSKFLAVGSGTIHARAGTGAQALDVLRGSDPLPERRQAGIVDAAGRAAAHTGSGCTGWAGHAVGDGFACQGNMLVSGGTVEAMVRVIRDEQDLPLPERLVRCLAAAQAAGGDARGQQSAALLVVRVGGGYGGLSDRLVDLRVDDHPDPIAELGRILALHRLYFDRPKRDDLLPIEGDLLVEIAARLSRARGELVDPADPAVVWTALARWAGRENLEERMVEEGRIDPTILRVLRQRDEL
jgi:uncharacterized Ntn-hydrolase superfamily protein